MPIFSDESKKQLATCHPELQLLFNEVIKYYDCKVLEGYRNRLDQEKAFDAGNSKLHYPFGNHNKIPSQAVDVCPYPVPSWNSTKDFIYFAGKVMGIATMLLANGKMTHQIRYGGDFNLNQMVTDSTFFDGVHFELLM